jgi:hypothetical protein
MLSPVLLTRRGASSDRSQSHLIIRLLATHEGLKTKFSMIDARVYLRSAESTPLARVLNMSWYVFAAAASAINDDDDYDDDDDAQKVLVMTILEFLPKLNFSSPDKISLARTTAVAAGEPAATSRASVGG